MVNKKKVITSKFKLLLESYSSQIDAAKKFLLTVLTYGAVINYALNALLGVPFTIYGFPAFGILYYFIKDEFTEWIRGILEKR